VKHNLEHAQWAKDLQKVVRWFLNADDNPDSHQNLIIIFSPMKFACKFILWYLH